MDDALPPPASPIPPPDRHQIERLNTLWNIIDSVGPAPRTVRGQIGAALRRLLAPLLFRQHEFNAALVDHLNRNSAVDLEVHASSVRMMTAVDAAVDELRRHQQALLAHERRNANAIESLASAHDELRASIGVLQHAAHTLSRQLAGPGEGVAAGGAAAVPAAAPVPPPQATGMGSHTYVGFEDHFRGSQDDIRRRLADYLPLFEGASDVLDIGCGRGEFLALLKERGVAARGIDVNPSMVDVCRRQGLDATEADALSYVNSLPDASLGGILAAQVVEHLEPRYLTALLDAAFHKLRPGAVIALETINPACWFAFFESYIRDLTHVRPIHPDTLKYLLVAGGFQRVEIQYRAPYPEHDKLQPIPPNPTLGDSVETLNANVERINRLLFTWLDYAAIGRRP